MFHFGNTRAGRRCDVLSPTVSALIDDRHRTKFVRSSEIVERVEEVTKTFVDANFSWFVNNPRTVSKDDDGCGSATGMQVACRALEIRDQLRLAAPQQRLIKKW